MCKGSVVQKRDTCSLFFFFCRSFSNFQYFDSTGMFISLVYSIPLLLNTIIIVVSFLLFILILPQQINDETTTQHLFVCVVHWQMVWVHRTFSTMTELKTLQLKRKARREKREKNDWSLLLCPKMGFIGRNKNPCLWNANPDFWQIPSCDRTKDCSLMSVRTGCLFF